MSPGRSSVCVHCGAPSGPPCTHSSAEGRDARRWLAAGSEVGQRLQRGARVALVGGDLGDVAISLAASFPRSTIHAFDTSDRSLAAARLRAAARGVAERVTVEPTDHGWPRGGDYDVVWFVPHRKPLGTGG